MKINVFCSTLSNYNKLVSCTQLPLITTAIDSFLQG